jgi:hypothetical protein
METVCDKTLVYSYIFIFLSWCFVALIYAVVTIIRRFQLAKHATELELRRRYDIELGHHQSRRSRTRQSTTLGEGRSAIPTRTVRVG